MNKTVLFLVKPYHAHYILQSEKIQIRHRFLFVSLASLPMLGPALKGLQPRLLLDQDQVVLLVSSAKDLVQEIAIFVQVLNIFFFI